MIASNKRRYCFSALLAAVLAGCSSEATRGTVQDGFSPTIGQDDSSSSDANTRTELNLGLGMEGERGVQ